MVALSTNPDVPAARRAVNNRANHLRGDVVIPALGWIIGLAWFAGGLTWTILLPGAYISDAEQWAMVGIFLLGLLGAVPAGLGASLAAFWLDNLWCERRVQRHRRAGHIVTVSGRLQVMWEDALREAKISRDHRLATLDANFHLFANPLVQQYDEVLGHDDTSEEDKRALHERLKVYFNEAAQGIKAQQEVLDAQAKLTKSMDAELQHSKAQALLSQPLL